jgi:ribosomal-protein-alanine N-acetyltransferase
MQTQINEAVFESFPTLESERLLFRNFKDSDAKDIFYLKTDSRVMEYMDSVKHKSLDDSLEVIKKNQSSFNDKTGVNWAIIEKSTHKLIGYFGYWRLFRDNSRGEIGYSLKPEYWGKGYMFEAMTKLIGFGFKELHLHSIEANINPNNRNSEKLLLKFGFKKEAYFRENYLFEGEFLDSIIYSLLESDIK